MLQVLPTLFVHALLALAVTASAQPALRLSGVVRDATGRTLPGVTVTITGASLGTPQTVIASEQGLYALDALVAGRYEVTAELAGFETRSVAVDVGDGPATADLVLTLSPLSELVTVTATKSGAADIQTTPIAVSVLLAPTLEQIGIRNLEGLAGFVPTLTISQNTGNAQVTIRGIGTNSPVVGSDPSSTVHLDGVYLGRPVMVFADFLNVERVEVLRGPQGTLYGRNSVGGTINIVTRQPTNARETSVRLTAGTFNTLRADAALSGPLVRNRLMGSVALLRNVRDGVVADLEHPGHALGGEDTWAGRGQLRVVLGNRGEVLLSGDYGRYEGIPLTYAKPIEAKRGFSFDSPSSLWAVRTNEVASARNTQQGGAARLTVRVSDTMTLTSLTAYRKSNYRYFVDGDATELKLQTADVPDLQHQLSEEVTLVGRTQKFAWIGGMFLFDDSNEGKVEITTCPPPLCQSTAGTWDPRTTQIRPFATIGTDARAVFGQTTYTVSSRVSVTAGVRYTDERKDLVTTGGVYRFGTEILANPATFYDFAESARFSAWTPRASIQMRASPNTFAYVSATRGFKSGGFNPAAREKGKAGFGPEFAWSYEGGLKHAMAGGRIHANTSLFYTDYQDLQVQSFLAPGVPEISNAGAATIRGIEVEVAATPGHGLRVVGHVSRLEATYDRYAARRPGGATGDAAGNTLNNAPEWSGSASAVYEFAVRQFGTATARGDVSWQSRVFFTPFNEFPETQSPYGLVHLRAGFEPPSRRWEIAVYVRNAGSTGYVTGTANVAIPAFSARPGEPRHWGTQFTLRP